MLIVLPHELEMIDNFFFFVDDLKWNDKKDIEWFFFLYIMIMLSESHLGVAIHVDGSCSCSVNARIVSTFANTNPIQIINVSTLYNPNPTHLLFVLGHY